jgi:hypothetical protein
VSGHRELTPTGTAVQLGETCTGEPFPVAGWDFRSGGGDRRADSSRGRDDDALAIDLHDNHGSRDAPNCSTHIFAGRPALDQVGSQRAGHLIQVSGAMSVRFCGRDRWFGAVGCHVIPRCRSKINRVGLCDVAYGKGLASGVEGRE